MAVRGGLDLIVVTVVVVVRRTVWVSPSPCSTVMVASDTCTVRVCRAKARPHPIRCFATQIVPLASASRCTVTGSRVGLGGGPAGRSPRSRSTWAEVSGLRLSPQQGPGFDVEQHQHRGVRCGILDLPAGEQALAAVRTCPARAKVAAGETPPGRPRPRRPSASPVEVAGRDRRAGRPAPPGGRGRRSRARSATVRWERDALDPGTADRAGG